MTELIVIPPQVRPLSEYNWEKTDYICVETKIGNRYIAKHFISASGNTQYTNLYTAEDVLNSRLTHPYEGAYYGSLTTNINKLVDLYGAKVTVFKKEEFKQVMEWLSK